MIELHEPTERHGDRPGHRDRAVGQNQAARSGVRVLAPREREVLMLVGAGLTNAGIGRRPHLAEGTVKIHVSAVLGELHRTGRARAAIHAYRAGLVE